MGYHGISWDIYEISDQLEMVPAPRWTCPSDRPRAETCHCPGNQRPRKPGSWWYAWLSNGSPMNQVRKLRKSHDFTILVEKIPGRTGETWWNHMKCQWRIAMAQNPIETATKLETYQFQTQNMSVLHYIVHYSDCRWHLQGWPLAKFSLMRPLPRCVVRLKPPTYGGEVHNSSQFSPFFGTKVYPHVSFSKNPNSPIMKTSEIAIFVGTLHTQPPGRETLVTFSKAPHVLLRWRGFVVEGEVGGHHRTVRADVEIARNPGRHGPWRRGLFFSGHQPGRRVGSKFVASLDNLSIYPSMFGSRYIVLQMIPDVLAWYT